MSQNKIIRQMFDVRPVNKAGDLDWKKIQKVSENYSFRKEKIASPEIRTSREFRQEEKNQVRIRPRITSRPIPRKAEVYVLGQKFESDALPIFNPPAEMLHEVAPEAKVTYKQKFEKEEKGVNLLGADDAQEETDQICIRPRIRREYVLPSPKAYILGKEYESEDLPVFSPPAEMFLDDPLAAFAPEQKKIAHKETSVVKEDVVEQIVMPQEFVPPKSRIRKSNSQNARKIGIESRAKFQKIIRFFSRCVSWPFISLFRLSRSGYQITKKILLGATSFLWLSISFPFILAFKFGRSSYNVVQKASGMLLPMLRQIISWPIKTAFRLISLSYRSSVKLLRKLSSSLRLTFFQFFHYLALSGRSGYRLSKKGGRKTVIFLWFFVSWPLKMASILAVAVGSFSQRSFRKIISLVKKIVAWPLVLIHSLAYFSRTIFPSRKNFSFSFASNFASFSAIALLIIFAIGTTAFWNKGVFIQGKVLGASQEGYENINIALSNLKNQNFEESIAGFNEANLKFSEASEELDKMGSLMIGPSRFIPFASKLSSGSNMIEAAKKLSLAGEELVKTTQVVARFKEAEKLDDFSLLDLFRETQKHLELAQANLKKADTFMAGVNVADLPEDKREKFVTLKTTLPSAILAVDTFLNNELVLSDLLGGNGPRKYLFLFQNNQEMRATGGFIGSYGLLDISGGRIRNFFIDGIFNPDGQLKEKIIPPVPIQKISAAWSLHDSNWFPDFPASAREAIVFYEKTGGPTTDGVITLTPTVLQKLLEITGPIEMKEYDVVLDSHNFIEKTQYEVELDYDKVENKPKKILSDLAPLILDKLFSARDLQTIIRTLDVFVEALNQKQILIFSQNAEMQKIISEQGWSGEVLATPKDYLSVINSNINGFKTDGVIDEKIEHQAEIQDDGTIIDTVTITRHHNGGNTGYVWWDKVNSDYLRIYVPLGSKFLSVEGQTREFTKPPLDYAALGFKKDARVEKEESAITIDEATGTRIYEDFGKTVFANWTYVSPQETMTLKYRYQLPFKMNFSSLEKSAQSYSLLAQKQSGSLGSEFSSELVFPRKYNVIWRSPEDLQLAENELQFKAVLNKDRFWGAAFTQKSLIINQ